MARKQAVPLEIEIPEEPVMPPGETSSSTRTRRTRSRPVPAARNLRGWLRSWLLRTVAAAGLLLLLFAAYQVDHFLAASPRFRLPGTPETVDNPNFRIDGVKYAGRERVARVFAVDFGRSVYLMPLDERRRQLLALDWIREASIERLWPNRITVTVTERRPVAFVALPDAALVDASGVILSQPDRAPFNLPVLTGISRAQSPALRRQRVQMMLDMLTQVGREAAAQISEIDVSDYQDLQITLAAGAHAYRLHLGNSNYQARLRNFYAHFEEITKRPTYTVFDLRIDDRITAMEVKSDGK